MGVFSGSALDTEVCLLWDSEYRDILKQNWVWDGQRYMFLFELKKSECAALARRFADNSGKSVPRRSITTGTFNQADAVSRKQLFYVPCSSCLTMYYVWHTRLDSIVLVPGSQSNVAKESANAHSFAGKCH
jgi:hypothetical protein